MKTGFKLRGGSMQPRRGDHDAEELLRRSTPEVEQFPKWSWRSWKDWAALLLTIAAGIFYLYLFYHG